MDARMHMGWLALSIRALRGRPGAPTEQDDCVSCSDVEPNLCISLEFARRRWHKRHTLLILMQGDEPVAIQKGFGTRIVYALEDMALSDGYVLPAGCLFFGKHHSLIAAPSLYEASEPTANPRVRLVQVPQPLDHTMVCVDRPTLWAALGDNAGACFDLQLPSGHYAPHSERNGALTEAHLAMIRRRLGQLSVRSVHDVTMNILRRATTV